jgi:hypothetical protein
VPAEHQLFGVIETINTAALRLRLAQGGQQHRREDGDDGDDNQ